MSRRKQARPIRVLEDGSLPAPALHTGESSGSGSEDEGGSSTEHLETGLPTCLQCQSEFGSFTDLAEHAKECSLRKLTNSPDSVEDIPDDEYDHGEGDKRQEEALRQRQDAENNNSVEEGETEGEAEAVDTEMPVGFPFALPGAAGHVTLEALQNTKVAVAQFAATAMANNADNTAALQELAVLQSTLYTLQHQQMMQLNLIQQLQQQLQITRPKEGSPSSPPAPSLPLVIPQPTPTTLLPKPSRTPTPVKQEVPLTPPTSQSVPATHSQPPPVVPKSETSPPVPPVSLPPCSISSSFASSIITNLDPPPSPSEPNTLEMLQRRAQEVLDNASQGLLANNLADELAFRKNGGKGSLSPYDSKTGGRNEPFFKHRCRYCGKVFGSDSALQIHIRSHTGERPFKCNVCGSRFTTKGNLKVHFQRHSAKFPHIKMNPNPVPEHLDKYHPPLLAQIGAHQSLPPGVPSHHPGSGPHPGQFPSSPQFPSGLPMYRPPPPPSHDLVLPPHARSHESMNKPIIPLNMFSTRMEQEMPENLSKSVSSEHSSPISHDQSDRFKKEIDEEPKDMTTESNDAILCEPNIRLSPKQEMEPEGECDQEPERYPSPPPYDECSLESKYTSEDVVGERESPGLEKNDDSLQDQPENLSNKINGEKSPRDSPGGSEGHLTPSPLPPSSLVVASLGLGRSGPQLPPPQPPSPCPSNESSTAGALDLTPRSSAASSVASAGPSPGPSLFPPFGLLPPGSSPLITSALSSLTSSVLTTTPFNPLGLAVGPPVRGNTTCNLCFKTFACNSALEIHYRSHTKERPFKCTICERGFSTKGNMKQHMLTHKIRDMPPHLFEQKGGSGGTPQAPAGNQPTEETPPPTQLESREPVPPPQVPIPPQQQPVPTQIPQSRPSSPPLVKQEIGVKRSPPQGDTASMPLPKRQPSLPKHLCHVCNKNFSSSSALQIHMRTHTGDKPFRCTICHKAFTTKGNLKVHMGTHMWTNGASRRGRRMSLELPPLPKDSDFLHRRPDLFYPYLPAPFLNGIHQKLNEIPMSQSGGGSHNGMLSYGGFPGELKRESRSPDKPPHSGATPPSLWDLQFSDRKSSTHPNEDTLEPSPPPAAMPPPRGEGLAA